MENHPFDHYSEDSDNRTPHWESSRAFSNLLEPSRLEPSRTLSNLLEPSLSLPSSHYQLGSLLVGGGLQEGPYRDFQDRPWIGLFTENKTRLVPELLDPCQL